MWNGEIDMGDKKPRRSRSTDALAAGRLFERVRNGDSDAAYELTNHFRRGFPLERLRELFRSDQPDVVASAAYIASELGSTATPLIDEFPRALAHPESWGRSAGLDCVWNCATTGHGALIAHALLLLDDPSIYTRGVAILHLEYAPAALIMAALPFLKAARHYAVLTWFASGKSRDHAEIVSKLRSEDPLERRVALAAAARPTGAAASGSIQDEEALIAAAETGDPEVAMFAKDVTTRLAEIRTTDAHASYRSSNPK